MKKYITPSKLCSLFINRSAFLLIVCMLSINPMSKAFAEEQTEPKALQRLYKCFDKEIYKHSIKKKREPVKKLMKKCSVRLDKWLAMLPEESHSAFLSQMEESVNLSLEAAKRGDFVADVD